MFEEEQFELKGNINKGKIVVLNITDFDDGFKQVIDEEISSICFGDNVFSIKHTKEHIIKCLSKDVNKKIGAVAEFFVHLYLKINKYKQESIFSNLEEEGSLKRGFDGVYIKDEKVWFMESKSGYDSNSTHQSKVLDAYNDLYDKFIGKKSNDPWLNAYNHVRHIDYNNVELLEMLKNYSETFGKVENDINDFNIIPCGTIYVDDKVKKIKTDTIVLEVDNCFKDKKYKDIVILCITNKAINEFETYLKE